MHPKGQNGVCVVPHTPISAPHLSIRPSGAVAAAQERERELAAAGLAAGRGLDHLKGTLGHGQREAQARGVV